MSCPRIEVDLGKIRRNTQTIVRRLGARGIGVTGVTKAVCGHPAIAQAMLDGGATGLADARISNVQRMRQAGLTCPIALIRTPMLSQADQVVRSCDASYNTEISAISALAAAAIRKGAIHNVILMVEMGDQRDGIRPQNLVDTAQQVLKIPGVALTGIGANFACLNGSPPTAVGMAAFAAMATKLEGSCGPVLETLSGGNSASLPWALGKHAPGRVNDLRLGEAILLGVEPVSGDRINGMHADAFTLVAEVIETAASPAPSAIALISPALARIGLGPAIGVSGRHILAIGHQDTDICGLSMPAGSTLIGATSDHLVIGANRSIPVVGSEMSFPMNYKALMHAMAAPDVKIKLLGAPLRRQSRQTPGKAEHLTLI